MDIQDKVLISSIYDMTAYVEKHNPPNNNQFVTVEDATRIAKEYAQHKCQQQIELCMKRSGKLWDYETFRPTTLKNILGGTPLATDGED